MVILGVCNANDSGAALIINWEIKSVANEERFTRKTLTRAFPENSIEYVLKSQGLTASDVDYIGCGAWGGIDPETTFPQLIEDIFLQLENKEKSTEKYILKRKYFF